MSNFDFAEIEKANILPSRVPRWVVFKICIVFFLLLALAWIPLSAPRDFPRDQTVMIPKGMSVGRAAVLLKEEGFIRSPFLFKVFVRLSARSAGIQAGLYAFPKKESVVRVARKMAFGVRDLPVVRVTIPEGFSVVKIAQVLEGGIPGFDTKMFIELARPYEGYLFPDTYFVSFDDTPKMILDRMRDTFTEKVRPFMSLPRPYDSSWDEIIIMASLIEREAKNDTERALISGILWRRISIGMPLQVDATFDYILGKASSELTLVDLKAESPYNTYTNKGLPPGPIASPGLASINAALYPQNSPYLYYLHGDDGQIRYARTHDEHVVNKARFIR